jgi:hypothetical protein
MLQPNVRKESTDISCLTYLFKNMNLKFYTIILTWKVQEVSSSESCKATPNNGNLYYPRHNASSNSIKLQFETADKSLVDGRSKIPSKRTKLTNHAKLYATRKTHINKDRWRNGGRKV